MQQDSEELRKQIRDLIKRGYSVRRPSPFHIKIGSVNYYPSRGKVTVDPTQKITGTGYDALLEALEKWRISKKLPLKPKDPSKNLEVTVGPF
jgi:hypothetical protein